MTDKRVAKQGPGRVLAFGGDRVWPYGHAHHKASALPTCRERRHAKTGQIEANRRRRPSRAGRDRALAHSRLETVRTIQWKPMQNRTTNRRSGWQQSCSVAVRGVVRNSGRKDFVL